MPQLKFDPQAADDLRKLAAENPQHPGYLAVKRLLFALKDENPADPVHGTAYTTDKEGRTYYREVGRHPDVMAVAWKRYPHDDLIIIVFVGNTLL